MAGYFVRVELDSGKFVSRDICNLTDSELERFIASQSKRECDGWNWVKSLAKWIRDNIDNVPEPAYTDVYNPTDK